MKAPPKHHYACLLIGDEILSGHVEESNLPKVIRKLEPVGYFLQEARIITDQPTDIARHLTQLRDAFSFVVTMGGLGPTHDDRTMQGYAMSFACERILHKDMYDFFMQKPRTTQEQIDAVRYMSMLPSHAEIITRDGAWPLIKVDNCFALPGLPSVCMPTADTLASILPHGNVRHYAECYVALFESDFAAWLTEMDAKYPAVSLGSYPIDGITRSTAMDLSAQANEKIPYTKIALTSLHAREFQQCFDELCQYAQEKDALVRVNSLGDERNV